jgi:hypothetical protein
MEKYAFGFFDTALIKDEFHPFSLSLSKAEENRKFRPLPSMSRVAARTVSYSC